MGEPFSERRGKSVEGNSVIYSLVNGIQGETIKVVSPPKAIPKAEFYISDTLCAHDGNGNVFTENVSYRKFCSFASVVMTFH